MKGFLSKLKKYLLKPFKIIKKFINKHFINKRLRYYSKYLYKKSIVFNHYRPKNPK